VYTDVLYDPLVDPLNPKQRTVLLQEDSWYPGTCEVDIICDTGAIAQAEAEVTRLLQSLEFFVQHCTVCEVMQLLVYWTRAHCVMLRHAETLRAVSTVALNAGVIGQMYLHMAS
jgi:hypothetical protein